MKEEQLREIFTSDRIYKVPELANILGVTPEYIYKLLNKGKIKGLRIGTEWRIPASEVKTLIIQWNSKPTRKRKKLTLKINVKEMLVFLIGFMIGFLFNILVRVPSGRIK